MVFGFSALPAAVLNWTEQSGHRRAALTVLSSEKTGFTEVAAAGIGIRFTNTLAEDRSLTNQIFLNGSGVAAGDVDGDGRCDLYFCGLDSPNALHRNVSGWRFEDITAPAGVACADQASTGAAFADVDGDGDLDLLVNGIARGTRLFLNDGKARFREATEQAGLRTTSGAVSMTLADIDGDGTLDLYVVNYRNDTMRDMPEMRFDVRVTNGVYQLLSVNDRPASSPDLRGRFTFDRSSGVLENGEADVLFRNSGHGRFIPVSWTNGAFLDESGSPIQTPYDWGLSAMFRDLNSDGAPDLYVCNDFQSPDRIWLNDSAGRFRAIARDAIRQTSLFSMGVDFADIDRDGHDDIFVADMLSPERARRQVQVMDPITFAQVRNPADDRPQSPRNTLFHNRGNGTYAEIAQLSGLAASDWSWCPAFLDVDLDGYEDLLITTGHWRDAQHADVAREIDDAKKQRQLPLLEQLRLRKRFPRLDQPNYAFRNRGNLTFEDASETWDFDSRRISHGMAFADLDNDGDLDIAINCLNDAPLLYRNDSPRPRIAIRLRGQSPNTRGVGSKIRVLTSGLPPQTQEMICAGRYLSSDDFLRTFAAQSETNRLTIEVTWRNGQRSVVENAPANSLYEIAEPRTAPIQNPKPKTQKKAAPLFSDASHLLNHRHADEPFDDFALQPLLPHKLSQPGPGVTWFDFNNDGWDDLFIGAGRGGRLAVFRNTGDGGFVPQKAKPLESPVDGDLTTILGWRPDLTNAVLLMGLANYERTAVHAPGLRQFSIVTGESDDRLWQSTNCTGPLAMADCDADGDLDLFVGGRVVPGRYPEAASSALLRNTDGRLHFDAEASTAFAGIGLVSGAAFTDLDSDGWPELVLACESGPIRVFRNQRGKLALWNAPVIFPPSFRERGRAATLPASTLNELTGWWNSIAVADFDNDGRMDLVAGNWGRNTFRQNLMPWRLYFGDVHGSGKLTVLETHHDPRMGSYVPTRDRGAVTAALPMLQERFPTFAAFSKASVTDLLAADLPPMSQVNVVTFDSVLLLNRGDHFVWRVLPIEAQFSPVFGVAAGDLDGDGNQDIFLAQNFFEVSTAESRQDAGCGLLLRGNGNGDFKAIPPGTSGLEIYGEGRGAALADFDHDGRLDLVVGQNRRATKFYRNAGASPGLRVHLRGAAKNPQAIGASVRAVPRNGTPAPAKEIRLGAGYWSQDSTDLILGNASEINALQIRWPNGVSERVPVSAGARLISRTQPVSTDRD